VLVLLMLLTRGAPISAKTASFVLSPSSNASRSRGAAKSEISSCKSPVLHCMDACQQLSGAQHKHLPRAGAHNTVRSTDTYALPTAQPPPPPPSFTCCLATTGAPARSTPRSPAAPLFRMKSKYFTCLFCVFPSRTLRLSPCKDNAMRTLAPWPRARKTGGAQGCPPPHQPHVSCGHLLT
jgi:hypothetical protein